MAKVKRWRDERGQALLEFALLAPLIIIFLLAIVDFGVALHTRIVLDNAARDGARFASVGGHALSNGGAVATEGQIVAYTMSQAQDAPDSVTVCYDNSNANGVLGDIGDNVKITVNYSYDFVTGFTSMIDAPGTIQMDPSASARLERNAVSPTACA